MLRWSLLPCLLLCALLAACGGTSAPQPGPGIAGGLPGLASLGTPRQVQATDSYTFGEADKQAAQSAQMIGPEIVLQRSPLSWALLGANFSDKTPTSLTLTGVCNGLYIMVSDYASGRWKLLAGPLDAAGTFTLPGGISRADGSSFVAFLCPGNNVCDFQASIALTGGTPPVPEAWNVLVWLAGDNNLADMAVADLEEMEQVGSTDTLRLFAGFDIDAGQIWGTPVSGIDQARFIKVVKDTTPNSINVAGDPANQSFPRAGYDSSNPARVREFVDWVNANFPAQHTALVIWNHGDGWLPGRKVFSGAAGRMLTPAERAERRARILRHHNQWLRAQGGFRSASGVLGDESDGEFDLTNNAKLADALSGLHFDTLVFDACNMGQLEALYDYRGLADVLVGSECLVPGTGLPYAAVLGDFVAQPAQDPAQLGKSVVAEFTAHYTTQGEYASMTSFDATKIDALVSALQAFAGEVTAKAPAESDFVKQAMAGAFEPDAGDGSRDLQAFLAGYRGLTADTSIQAKIDAALAALDTAQLEFGQFNQAGSYGTTAWLPGNDYFDTSHKAQYASVPFNTATGWLAMLEATGVPGGGGGGGYAVQADWAEGDYVKFEWASDPSADIDMVTTDPDGTVAAAWDDDTANLHFSGDGGPFGMSEEWAQLKAGAGVGDYYIDAYFYDYDGQEMPVSVNVALYDSAMNLKQDLGSVMLLFIDDYTGYAQLSFAAP